MPRVCVCFLPADSELLDDHWLNKAAAARAPATRNNEQPRVHAEIFFPSDETASAMQGRSCGIHYGGTVFMYPKQFSKKIWQFRSLSVAPTQYNRMLDFCRRQVGGGFNYMGYFTPCNVSASSRKNSLVEQQKWFCSELVATALYHGGVLEDITDASMHPQSLYNCIEELTYADCGRNLDASNIQL